MPIEVRRFGVGHRRPDGPPGTIGVTGPGHPLGRPRHRSASWRSRAARAIEPHTNPNTTWIVVIEGGGWVGVADERTRVAAGEAVLWPADVPHAAWTEHSEMRAIVVEFAGPDDAGVRGLLDGTSATRAPTPDWSDRWTPASRSPSIPTRRATSHGDGEPA